MKSITEAIRCDREFRQAEATFREELLSDRPLPLVVNGLSGGAADAFTAELLRTAVKEKRNTVLLVSDEKEAARLAQFLRSADVPAAYYPNRDFNLYPVTASHDYERERLSVLLSLLSPGFVAVTTPGAAIRYTMPPSVLRNESMTLKPGDTIPPAELAQRLLRIGFAAVDTVEGIGQFARRGGILDLFSPGEDYPVRVEFFGDEIDRMGHFDPLTQRLFENCDSLSLLPAKEVLTDGTAREKIKKAVAHRLAAVKSEAARDTLQREMHILDSDEEISFADKYLALLYDAPATLFDYADAENPAAIAVIGSAAVKSAFEDAAKAAEAEVSAMLEDGVITGKYARYTMPHADVEYIMQKHVAVHINAFSDGTGNMRLAGLFGFRCRKTVSYGENLAMMADDLGGYIDTGYRVVICVENPSALPEYEKTLREKGFSPTVADIGTFSVEELPYGTLLLTAARLPEGFELMNARIAVITTAVGGKSGLPKKRVQRRVLKKVGAGARIMSYAELSPGDYVVHDTHGIGQYEGIDSMTIGGVTRDYVTIRYAGTDKIHIPADKIESVSKYIGARAEDGSVRLSRIGGTEWYRAKEKAKRAAKDIAKDLIRLYAERKRRPGFAYPEDCDLEREFANSFEFEETEPQLSAIEEIKQDMMRPCPMDRLLCGDVGFGKTEVAFRAVFKAIVAGKQTAILVPTTILALQHYETALSRFRGYPVAVEMLSSFRTPKAQEKILRRLARGEIDLIIGTHSLLGKNVKFRDLGLLVIDEEQRFGVGQKEKLKQMAVDVDVLTLSATPIPRTLNMAMSGIRDMSVLDEAPLDRHPVQTYVMEHDDAVINEAIRRELRRAGQVLYLYNRVETIDLCAGRLKKALPDARIVYAHGKMEKDELEEIWQELVRGEIDVLVCTTIIETGVDLPNANTLIIEDADRMGLSQLHQIRGRVGRSGRHAYAYFTYRRGKALTDIAEKRLAAIRDYAEFGAGFRIALRDLEIRGAGNLLGAEQHGHIDAVGYDMYVRLLNEAILEEKGEKAPPPFESKVDIAEDALIPKSYVAGSSQRMDMYKKISLIRTKEDMDDVTDEFCDRFGEPPSVTLRLCYIALCRAAAEEAHISRIEQNGAEIRFHCEKIDLAVWSELFLTYKGLSFSGGTRPYIAYKIKKGEDPAIVAATITADYCRVMKTPPSSGEGEKNEA